MMPRLSVKIMAHEKRAHLVPDLVERLGLTDDDVIWDRHNNRWDTGRRAWEEIDQTADWGMVVQDDALPCADLIAGMELALERVPNNVLVTPYIGTRRPVAARVERVVREAAAAKAAFIEMPSLCWGVAITAPTNIINDMLPWCDVQNYPNYDRRIGRYAIDVRRMSTWCTFPSLVDHRDIPSLVGHGGGRIAHHFIGETASALDVDWDAGSVRMGGTRTTARYLGGSAQPPGPYGNRGYHVARKLRVPKQGRQPDIVPERPEG